jgi:DNA polymerase sigma
MTGESSNSIIEVTKLWIKKEKKEKEMNNPYLMTLESCVFKCMNNGM